MRTAFNLYLISITGSVVMQLTNCFNSQYRQRAKTQLAKISIRDQSDFGSSGVECAISFLNSIEAKDILIDFAFFNKELKSDANKENMWTGGNFVVTGGECKGILKEGILLQVNLLVKGKAKEREILVPFPYTVEDERMLKNALISMAFDTGKMSATGLVVGLPFGTDHTLPLDFRFNDVPHAAWVRAYIYDTAARALSHALSSDHTVIPDKARMQMKINIPELNPAFDTYRIGTMLEMIRAMVLPLVYDGKRVRVCVQQSLGEGVLAGMPLALSSMRPVMEKMDWCGKQKGSVGEEGEVRFGKIGADQIRDDDDLLVLIAPQNVVGGSLMPSLEAMAKEAARRSVPMVLLNPLLEDRPSANNVMQIRGRAERRAFADSFQEILCVRLLYPSTGGYMYPIRGLLCRKDAASPYVAYTQRTDDGHEAYLPIAAFPAHLRAAPDISVVSSLFTAGK